MRKSPEIGRNRRLQETAAEISLRDIEDERVSTESLTLQERAELIERVLGMIREVDPTYRAKYQNLLMRLCQGAGGISGRQDPIAQNAGVIISDEYDLHSQNGDFVLTSRVARLSAYSELGHVGVELLNIDHANSSAYLLCVTEDQKRCFINMKLFKPTMKDGTTKNVLYIADRYVGRNLRGKGLGDQLLTVAENIARANGCTGIFAQLVPENPNDLGRLEEGMNKAGFSIHAGKRGEVIAEKEV